MCLIEYNQRMFVTILSLLWNTLIYLWQNLETTLIHQKKLCQDWEVMIMFKLIGRHIKFQKYIAGLFCIYPEKMCSSCFDILVKLILCGIYFLYYCRSFYMCYTISNFYSLLHLGFREIILITAKDEFCRNFLLIFI